LDADTILQGEQVLLRAYLQSADRSPHTPTHERLVKAARQQGLAGATVLRGILGAGSHGIIKRSMWSLVEHVPVIVEIVDNSERIEKFIDGPVAQLMQSGLLTLERANVMLYRHGKHDQPTILQLGELLKPLSTLPRIEEKGHMKVNENGVLLRVFIGESDRFEKKPLYEAIVGKVRELGLAGATVLRGTEGFGAHSVVHRASLLEMSTDLPIVVEIVDTEAQIKRLLPSLEAMVREGMITMEYVVILMYRDESAAGSATPHS
jgi:PII-like signaling protein